MMLMDNATISDGNLQSCYNILIEDDNTTEPQELFYVALTLLPDAIQSLANISPNHSSVLIIDNDGTVDNTMLLLLDDSYSSQQCFKLALRWLSTHSVKMKGKSPSMLLERTLLLLAKVSLWRWPCSLLPLPEKVCLRLLL